MDDISDLLRETIAASQPAPLPVVQQKMADIKAAADAKQVALGSIPTQDTFNNAAIMRATGAGIDSATPLERDLALLPPDQLAQKYGADRANSFNAAVTAAGSQFTNQRSAYRTTGQTAYDLGAGAVAGIVDPITQIGALGAGALSPIFGPGLGVKAAQISKSISDAIDGSESAGLQAHREAAQELSALQNSDTLKKYRSDLNQAGNDPDKKLMAGIDRMGADAQASISNSLNDPTLLSDQAAQVGGGLITMGPEAKGISMASKAIVPTALRKGIALAAEMDRGLGVPSLARAVDAAGQALPSDMQVLGGGINAGGAYTNTVNDAYTSLVNQGVDPDEAADRANKAGLIAGTIAGVGGGAATHFSERFERNPFTANSFGEALSNIGRQTVDQAAQGAVAQIGQNTGRQAFVDQNADQLQGVGAALGSGALIGALTAGALQAPALAGHAVGSTIKAAGEKVIGKGKALQDANEVESPYSTENVSKAGADMAQVAQDPATEQALQSATTLVKAGDAVNAQDGTPSDNGSKIEALGQKILDYGKFNASEVAWNPNLSDDVKATLAKTTTRTDAILALASDVTAKGADTPEGLTAASEMSKQIDGMSRVVNSDPDAFAAMADDHPAAKLINKFDDLHERLSKTPSVVEAFNKLKGLTEEQVDKLITPVTESSLNTRDGQQNVDNALTIAAHVPEKGNLAVNQQILEMAERGKLELKPDQIMALKASIALIKSDQEASAAQAKAGNKPLNKVTDNVLTAPGESSTGHNSAARYTKNIYDAMKAGNIEHAQSSMSALGHFVQHMQNKVAALNTHYEQGSQSPKISFDAWNPTKQVRYPTTGNERAAVHTHDRGSIEYAQTVAHEAQRLTEHFNNLSKAFPELKAGDFEHTKLHPNLQGKPEDVVRDHKDGTLTRPETPKDRSSLVQKAEPTETFQDHEEPVNARTDEVAEHGNVELVDAVSRSDGAQDTSLQEAEKAPIEAEATPGSEGLRASEELSDQGAKADANVEADRARREAKFAQKEKAENERAEAPKTTKDLAPDLVHSEDGAKGTNWFHKAYKVVQDGSRLLTDSKPVNTLMKAFKSHDALETHMGSERKLPLTPEVSQAYRGFLKNVVPALRETLEKRLTDKLNGKANATGKDAGKTPLDLLNEGKFNEFNQGKVTNLVERQADGSYKYNDGLANKAILAGLQWLLTYTDHSAPNDAESLSKITGLPEDDPQHTDMLEDFKGLTKLQAVRSLAEKIEQYWGVKPDNDVSKEYTDGISTAMAAEILQSLTDTNIDGTKLLVTHELSFTNKEGKPRELSMHERNMYVTDPDTGVMDPRFKDPRLIDDAVLTDPPHRDYYSGDKIKVAKTQLHNPNVDLTKPQRAMIQVAQSVEHFVNEHMHHLYEALGRNQLLDLLGGGADLQKRIDARTINAQDAKSLAGKNQTVGSGYDYLMNRVEQMRQQGMDLQKEGARYEFGVAVNGRLMMQGPENPQASKLVREVFLPTWSTLDLTKPANMDLFKTAIAQAIGLKIHQISTDDMRTQTDALLNGKLKNTIQMLRDHLNGGDLHEDFVNEIKANLGGDLTPNAMHALQEYARYLDSTDKNTFRTGLYIEADGVSNGVVNALHMFTGGEFNGDQIANMKKGGWLPSGEGQARTMNEYRANDGTDIYKAVSNQLTKRTTEAFQSYPDGHPVKAQMGHLFSVMEALLKKGDVTYDQDTGAVTLARGITKNPVTITFYGSGAKGIAGNIAGELFSEIYKRLSKVAADPDKNMSAMFDGDEAKTKAFIDSFEKLMTHVASGKPGELSLSESEAKRSSFSAENWKITKDEFNAVQQNVLRLLVDPMTSSVTDVLGSSVMKSKDLLQKATQAQSVALAEVYKQRLQAMKEANGGKFPSENDMQQALKELQEQFPLIDTGDQRFFPVKRAADGDNGSWGRGLNGEFETNGEFNGPADAGVSGLATMNQGMGDGRMIQTMLNNGARGLPVFDGFNGALDKINSISEQANKAVNGTWKDGNPLKAVHESFATFMESVRNGLLDDPKIANALIKAMYPDRQQAKTKPADVLRMLQGLEKDLASTSKEIDARHQAINETNYTVDQMAGAQSPYENKGKELPTTDGEIANALNTRVREILTGKKADMTPYTEPKALTVSTENLGTILAVAKFLPQQLGLMRRILNSGTLDNFQIISGTLKQIEEFRAKANLNMPKQVDGSTKGFLDPVNKVLHLISPTGETLLHEVIHAATFQTILDYYEGRNKDALVAETVAKLEALRDQFINVNSYDGLPDSFFDASKAVNDALQEGTPLGNAKALNEFMAWTIANKDLAKVAKGTTVDSLVQIAKDVWTNIKKMLFGNYAPKVGDDLYSNLVFHTSVLSEIQARSQPTIADESRELSLMQNVHYGDDQRLSDINEKYDTLFGRFLKPSDPAAQVEARKNALQPVIDSAHLSAKANEVGFAMTQQAARTFRRTTQLMALSSKLNSASLSKMTELYRHAVDHLTAEKLVDKSDPDPQRALNTAQDKLDFLLGHTIVKFDAEKGSSFMPAFIGLSLVDDGLRAALRDLPLPKNELNKSGTLDARLENVAQSALDTLSRTFSNQGKAENVRDAIDNMTHFMADDALKDKTYFDVMSTAPSRSVNWANDVFNGWIKKGADAIYNKAGNIISDPKSTEVSKKIANFSQLISSIASEERTEHIAEGVVSYMNRLTGKNDFREIIGDIIGRTKNNAPVFDLIKAVRTLVAQTRQQFREHVPSSISKKFSRPLTEEDQSVLHMALGKTDAAALMDKHSLADTLNFVSDPKARASEKQNLESFLEGQDPKHWAAVKAKADQLANHMLTDSPGSNLLSNADAVAHLLLEKIDAKRTQPSDEYVKAVDRLTTLYALDKLSPETQKAVSNLSKNEPEGMNYVLSYLNGQRKTEMAKNTGMARFNSFKGYIPSSPQDGVSLVIAKKSDTAKMLAQSYTPIGDYQGSRLDPSKEGRAYFLLPASAHASFSEGIMQNVNQTAGGADKSTGFSTRHTAGRITNPADVAQIAKYIGREGATKENLRPIFNEYGRVVAFERMVDPDKMTALNRSTNISKMLGQWRGRQVEERLAQGFNEHLVDALHKVYTDTVATPSRANEFIDLWDSASYKNDKIISDAVSLMPPEIKQYIKDTFGSKFLVRKDLVNDAIGYRQASIGDAWTGSSRWAPEVQQKVQQLAMGVFGNNAYKTLVNAEGNWQNIIKEAKNTIVVKSLVVPATNFISNLYQLMARGVPVMDMTKNLPKMISEANTYTEGRLEMIKAEGDLHVAEGSHDISKQLRLKAKIQAIEDGFKRLSIYPLIKAGEFGAISSAGISPEDMMMTGGKMDKFFSSLVAKLPANLQTAGRYALVTRDTALYRGLQKSVEYGDFLGKALYYKHLTDRKGIEPETALAKATEEFVHFDRLPGRGRGYLDTLGMAWFFNHKLRASKIALSMIRDNPLQSLLSVHLSHIGPIDVETPIQVNFFSKAMDGRLPYALGPGMAIKAPFLNPWVNLYKTLVN